MRRLRSLQALFVAAVLAHLGLLACRTGGDGGPSASPFQAQVAAGARVYAAHCADCHGASGGGTDRGPALVGDGALPKAPRDWQDREREFRTALDVAVFATTNMPPRASDRAELTPHDYWAVLAFALSANGVLLEEAVGPDNAGDVVLHP